MVEILLSVAGRVSEYLVDPVVTHLGYLFHLRTNIDDLSDKVEKLKASWKSQRRSVDEAESSGHEIEDNVSNWLTRADEFIKDASKFLEDYNENVAARKSTTCCLNIAGACRPNLMSRYLLSRAAKKKAEDAVQIDREASQVKKISYRPPLQEINYSAPPSAEALESRISIMNQVMEALRDPTIHRIGVSGLGGVGKTTLVKQVAQQAGQEKDVFHKVLTASVLQTPDIKKIQGELADMLGMKFEEETEHGRAARLHQRMMKEKSILVILDDLWAKLELEKIGIPSPGDQHKGCKLLLTSRNRDILSNEMGTQKDFGVEHLEENEAWILFKNTLGDCIENNNPALESVAENIAKECAGLPLALVTLATALKKKSLPVWKNALQQLKQSSTSISGMETKVYSSLKLSYDYLEGDEVKSFFLLCGLFSTYIHLRDLLKYGVGLRLFQGTNTLEEARNRIDALVDNLKASNLLLETGDDNSFVGMHDFVRAVAVQIATKEHHVFTLRKASIRSMEEWPKMDEIQRFTMREMYVSELPKELVCPKLELFGCYDLNPDLVVEISDTFFEGMKRLNVLDLSRMHLPSLPSSLQCLTNLRTLCLDGCKLDRNLAVIVELKTLEILSLMGSDIEQLPREIAQLTRLRLLDLKGCLKLKVIPPHVISSLTRLEDLCMENSFTQWELEMDQGKSNASLAELKHLSHLTSLDIQIPDSKLLPRDTVVFDNLVRCRIFVGDVWSWERNYNIDRILKLGKFDTSLDHNLVDGVSKLLKRTEELHLRELCGGANAVSKVDGGEGFPKLKHLNVQSSPEIQCVAKSTDLKPSCGGAFPVMETLSLSELINLQELWDGQFPAGSFGCLRKVEVENCDGLKYLFSLAVARGLSRLEEIQVMECRSMVEMVYFNSQERNCHWEEIKEDDAVNLVPLFPELKQLVLEDLPKLWQSCNDIDDLSSKSGTSMINLLQSSSPSSASFQNLATLYVWACGSLKSLISPSVAKTLVKLKTLVIGESHMMEEVVANDQGGQEALIGDPIIITLGKLQHVVLMNLQNLTSFSSGGYIFSFPSLELVAVKECPNMRFFSPWPVTTPKLKRVHVAENEWRWQDDLNTTIQKFIYYKDTCEEVKMTADM